MAAALPLIALVGGPVVAPALACAAFLALVSLIDDVHSLPVEVRLPAHVLAAVVVVLAAPVDHGHPWLVAAIGIVAIAWMTNLFNFMDGADGLAGGMAAIGFATLAFAAREVST